MRIFGMSVSTVSNTAVAAIAVTLLASVSLTGCGNAGQTYSPLTKNGSAAPADFTLKVAETTPGSGTVAQGSAAQYTVTLTSGNGFAGAASLSVSGLPAGAGDTFTPTSVTPTASGAASALSITTTAATGSGQGNLAGTIRSIAATPTGTYTITITAAGGGVTHQATATLTVNQGVSPDFTIQLAEASAGSGTVAQGNSAHYTVTVTSVGSFSTPVTLALAGLPTTAKAVFGTTTLTPTAAGAATTVDVSTGNLNSESALTPVGAYTLTANGSAGASSHTSSAGLVVTALQTFTVTIAEATPGSGTVVQGATAHYIVTVTSVRGFSAPVNLSHSSGLPQGTNGVLGSATITPTADGVTTTFDITTTAPGGGLPATPIGTASFAVGGQTANNQHASSESTGTLTVLGTG